MAKERENKIVSWHVCANYACPCAQAAESRMGKKTMYDEDSHVVFSSEDVEAVGWTKERYPSCEHKDYLYYEKPKKVNPGKVILASLAVAGVACAGLCLFCGDEDDGLNQVGEDTMMPTHEVDVRKVTQEMLLLPKKN